MTCSLPPALNDLQLMAYADGEAGAEVASHIARCSFCRGRAERVVLLQGCLRDRLSRAECPTSLELGDYHVGLVSEDRAVAIARHLVNCSACRREVAELGGYLTRLAPELELSSLERARAQVRIWVARLMAGGPEDALSGRPAPGLGYAGLRGEEVLPRAYSAGEFLVFLEAGADPDRPDRRSILGFVIGPGLPPDLQLHVWQGERQVAMVPVDNLGNFIAADLAPDTCDLILASPDVEIHIQALELGTG